MYRRLIETEQNEAVLYLCPTNELDIITATQTNMKFKYTTEQDVNMDETDEDASVSDGTVACVA